MPDTCEHVNIVAEPCDQTIGVACTDCNTLLAYCWGDVHIPESLWNRLATIDPETRRCDENRDDFCAVCHEPMPVASTK